MARPSKYPWAKVWADFATGSYSDEELRNKYKIPRRTYDERKANDKPLVSAETKQDIEAFKAVSAKTAAVIAGGGENGEAMAEALELESKRLGLQADRFKIIKAMHSVLAEEMRKGNVDIKNIRNVSGALKDTADDAYGRQGPTVAIQNNNNAQATAAPTFQTLYGKS